MANSHIKLLSRKLTKLIPALSPKFSLQEFTALLTTEEASIGGKLFGPIPTGVRRDFFRLDAKTWVWNEVQSDGRVTTTRYIVNSHGIVAKQDHQPDRILRGAELANFSQAIETYAREVRALYATL